MCHCASQTYKGEDVVVSDEAALDRQIDALHGEGAAAAIDAAYADGSIFADEMPPRHDFVHEWSAESPYCGQMVMRNGDGDTCGLLRDNPVHT